MRQYLVSPSFLAERFPHPRDADIGRAVGELIARYGIRNRRILSLGGGISREERYLAELGPNDVTVIDLDQPNGNIEPALRQAPPGAMRYFIGDALEPWNEPFDVLYLSSFYPDEMRRHELLTARRVWPADADPFHPAVMGHAEKLPPGGWMFIQSIGYSLDVSYHPNYLPACVAQLDRHGLRLVEVHRFTVSKGVMLYAAIKLGPALTTFHGRAAPEPIERTYP
jgi:hypothetical protein